MHDKRVAIEEVTHYNFFTGEMRRCIQSLILAHVVSIQLYCVEKGASFNQRVINTNVVEWFFGDVTNMVCGATNQLRVNAAVTVSKLICRFRRSYQKSMLIYVFKP